MARYAVVKYFGHFRQSWEVIADSEKEAWDNAERDGERQYMSVYGQELKKEDGYIINLDEKEKNQRPISTEQYYQWMKEAVDMGMVIYDFEKKELEKRGLL